MEKHGLPERTRAEVRRFVGNGIWQLIQLAVPEGSDPGIRELIADLRCEGLKTAVVSNKADAAVQVLIRQYFPGLFDAVSGELFGVQRKPAPDTVNSVLSELSVSKEDAFYIGDSEVDLLTAQNAGMPCVTVTWGFRDKEELVSRGAQTLVDTTDELRRLLLDNIVFL